MQSESCELRDQISRMIAVESERNIRLRGKTPWHPFIDSDRADFLAWREVDGGREVLVYNNGLSDPFYVAFQPQ